MPCAADATPGEAHPRAGFAGSGSGRPLALTTACVVQPWRAHGGGKDRTPGYVGGLASNNFREGGGGGCTFDRGRARLSAKSAEPPPPPSHLWEGQQGGGEGGVSGAGQDWPACHKPFSSWFFSFLCTPRDGSSSRRPGPAARHICRQTPRASKAVQLHHCCRRHHHRRRCRLSHKPPPQLPWHPCLAALLCPSQTLLFHGRAAE
jgi:hypothetical protein